MDKWEYIYEALVENDIEEVCQRHGQDGWELASLVVTRYDNSNLPGQGITASLYRAAFKRKIATTSQNQA
jgi:hypothetical protein